MSEEVVLSIVAMICITVINVAGIYFIRKDDKYDATKD